MHDLLEELTAIENLVANLSKNPSDVELNEQLNSMFKAVSSKIEKILPAEDVKIKMDLLMKSIEEKKPKISDITAFIEQIKPIIKSLQQGLPLGISNREELFIIKKTIMDALNNAVILFEERFKEKLPDISDTKVYIVGSRVRGFSWDKKLAFFPGRDADILIVGEGIFNAELAYVEKIDRKSAEKFRKRGFVSGYDRRFVPPYMSEVAKKLSAIFMAGDMNLFGRKEQEHVNVNFHIGRPDSEEVKEELKIECQ